MEKNDFNLKDLQNAEYYMLCRLDTICKSLGIDLILGYGTLLGAIRHNGFIPWDDDIDVFISYKDYKKLKKHFKKHNYHIDGLFLADYTTDHETIHFLPRIRLDGTYVDEYATDELNINKGLWIDIFVFCNCAGNNKLFNVQKKLLGIITMLHEKYLNRYKMRHNVYFANSWIYVLAEKIPEFLRIRLISLLKNIIRILGSKNDKIFGLCMYEYKIAIPRKYLTETDEHIFETRTFKIPKDYDSYLRYYYGENYMTPVRKTSHFQLETVVYPAETADKVNRFINDELLKSKAD